MSKAKRIFRVFLLVLLGVSGLWAWPWSRDLVVQIFTRPQQYATVPPAGAIPVGWEAPLRRDVAERQLRNPLPAGPQTLERGRQLFATYCLPCHGPQGKGNGPVAGGVLLPADLTTARVQGQKDGALYSTIRIGFGLMPAYYSRLTPEERWQVVAYVRTLGRRESP